MSKQQKSEHTRKDLMSAFRIFDDDDDGCIHAGDLVDVLTSFGERFSKSEARKLVQTAAKKEDGLIDYQGEYWIYDVCSVFLLSDVLLYSEFSASLLPPDEKKTAEKEKEKEKVPPERPEKPAEVTQGGGGEKSKNKLSW